MITILLILNLFVYSCGLIGLTINKKNIVIMLISIELLILGTNLNFVIFSIFLDDLSGQIYSILLLALAAAESSIGLSILISYFRRKGNIAILFINLLKN